MIIRTTYDFNQNSVLNMVIHPGASTPGTPVAGQAFYNTTSNHAFIYNGTAWEQMSGEVPSIVSAAGFTGTVAGYAITLGVSISGLLKGSGGVIAAAGGADLPALNTITAPAGALSLNSQKITNLANGTASTDASNYGQVTSAVNSLSCKTMAVLATTTNITLSGEQSIDGVPTSSTRVLVKNQTVASQNGIYVSSSGVWARSADLSVGASAAAISLYVNKGTTQPNTLWICTSAAGSDIVGTNNLTFTQLVSGVVYTAGTGISIAGSAISVSGYNGASSIVTLGTITSGVWNGTTVAVANGGTGATTAATARANLGAISKYSATIGDGVSTSIVITQATHGLATNGQMHVQIFDSTTDVLFQPSSIAIANGTGTVTITFASAPASNAYRIVLLG